MTQSRIAALLRCRPFYRSLRWRENDSGCISGVGPTPLDTQYWFGNVSYVDVTEENSRSRRYGVDLPAHWGAGVS